MLLSLCASRSQSFGDAFAARSTAATALKMQRCRSWMTCVPSPGGCATIIQVRTLPISGSTEPNWPCTADPALCPYSEAEGTLLCFGHRGFRGPGGPLVRNGADLRLRAASGRLGSSVCIKGGGRRHVRVSGGRDCGLEPLRLLIAPSVPFTSAIAAPIETKAPRIVGPSSDCTDGARQPHTGGSVRQAPPAPRTHNSTTVPGQLHPGASVVSRRRLPQRSLVCRWALQALERSPKFPKMVWRAGLEPAQARYFPVLHRAYSTPSLTERNGTIRGPAARRPSIPVTAEAKCA